MALKNEFLEDVKELKELPPSQRDDAIDKLAETVKGMLKQIADKDGGEEKEIEVTNLDEIHLALKKTLDPVAKAIKGIKPSDNEGVLDQMILSNKLNAIEIAQKLFENGKNSSIKEIKQGAKNLAKELGPAIRKALNEEIQLKFPSPEVTVSVPEIKIPEIKIPDIKVPEIQVPKANVSVDVEAPTVNIDLDSLLDALAPLQLLSDRAKNPLSVKLSNGKNFVRLEKILEQVAKSTKEANHQFVSYTSGPSEVDISTSSQTAISKPQGYGTIGTGRKTVTTAGTAVQLSSTSVPCKKVIIIGEEDNTETIAVGGSSVVAALSTRQGIPLAAFHSDVFYIDNLNKIYIDSVEDGEGVTYVYYN